MKPLCILLLAMLAPSCLGACRAVSQENESSSKCAQWDKLAIPLADLPTLDDRQALASCNSVDLYFGRAGAVDAVKARKCAYLERERQKQAGQRGILQGDLGGAGVLVMIYANGNGAVRSFDLALKFACEFEDVAAAEIGSATGDERFRRLVRLQKEYWTGTDFNICDDINGTMSDSVTEGGLHAAEQCRDLNDAARAAKLNKMMATWSPAQKEAFAGLQRAAAAFFKTSSENEVDLPMTGAGAGFESDILEIDVRTSLDDGFIGAVEKFEHGQLPKSSAEEFRKADKQLNVSYSDIQSGRDDIDPNQDAPTVVTRRGVRETQRSWLAYREAWVKFGLVRYPNVTPDSWRAWVTVERIGMLQNVRIGGPR